ncbi:MAG TPA: four helix bundle protein [Gemmatimonadales bacterium]|nr:four helix bundle protein [Gemmatimonadales bacterium]
MGDFKQLQAWQAAMDLVAEVYCQTDRFPVQERYGLQGQLRRATVSIAANIAEGTGKGADREFVRYLRIARGSASEVECLIQVAMRLEYLPVEAGRNLDARVRSVSRLILALQRSLACNPKPPGT